MAMVGERSGIPLDLGDEVTVRVASTIWTPAKLI